MCLHQLYFPPIEFQKLKKTISDDIAIFFIDLLVSHIAGNIVRCYANSIYKFYPSRNFSFSSTCSTHYVFLVHLLKYFFDFFHKNSSDIIHINCILFTKRILRSQNQLESTAPCKVSGPFFVSKLKSFEPNPVNSLNFSSNTTGSL